MQQAKQFELPFGDLKERGGAIRRRVFRVHLEPLPDGTYVFNAKSFSRQDGLAYRCYVNPLTGRVSCSCKDFQFRKDRALPTMASGHVCKHLKRAIRTVRRLGRLRSAEPQIAA